MADVDKTIKITPRMMEALAAPMPKFHKTWRQYIRSDFRREVLKTWAGDDPEKQRAAKQLLDETTPM